MNKALNTILRQNLLFQMQRRTYTTKVYGQSGARNVLPFVDDAEDYDINQDYEKLSLDDFYSSLTEFKLSDELAIEYLEFAAKMACLKFKTQDEML